jgi:hypothetical protein
MTDDDALDGPHDGPPADELASAYLDGRVTADERIVVEADPELLARVERLAQVRALLGDPEPPSISLREEHLATALASWDRLPEVERTGAARDATPRALQRGADAASLAAAATITAPTSLADRRRTKVNRRVLGAAAAVVLVLGGGLVVRDLARDGEGGDDQLSSDAATATLAESATAAAESEAADAVTEEVAPGAGEAEQAPAATLDTGADDPAPPAERTLDRLLTPDDLAAFASLAAEAPAQPDGPVTTSAPIDDVAGSVVQNALTVELPLCLGADVVVGPALYQGTEVVVAVDNGRDLALAYRQDCREVARAPLP